MCLSKRNGAHYLWHEDENDPLVKGSKEGHYRF